MPELARHFVDTPAGLAECCAHLRDCAIVGFDTEFIGEDSYTPHLCLVQVATEHNLYVIDPIALGGIEPFWEIVADPDRIAVVHAGREEIRMCKLGIGRPPGNLCDLQIAAGMLGYTYPIGHGPLVGQLLNVRLSKAETLTDWARRPLSKEQIDYAYDDVRYLLPIYRKLNARLEKLQRQQWAKEEYAASIERAMIDNTESERWRKLRGIGSLDRRKLGLVKSLYQWREELAFRANRPPRTVVRDDLLVEIAKRSPSRERDLMLLRGLHRNHFAEILTLVGDFRHVPAEQLPDLCERDNDAQQVLLVSNLLLAILGNWCVEQSIAQPLVASHQDVKSLVRARYREQPLPTDLPIVRGWRAEQILPGLLAVLDGQHGIRIRDVRAQSPLQVLPLPQPGA